VCFDFLYNGYLEHFSFEEELSEIWSKMYIGLHVKYPLFLTDFNETWILMTFSKYTQISNFIKIRPVTTELFRTDGRTDRQTDMTKLIFAFRNFASAPPNLPRYSTFIRKFDPQTPIMFRETSEDYTENFWFHAIFLYTSKSVHVTTFFYHSS